MLALEWPFRVVPHGSGLSLPLYSGAEQSMDEGAGPGGSGSLQPRQCLQGRQLKALLADSTSSTRGKKPFLRWNPSSSEHVTVSTTFVEGIKTLSRDAI